MVSIYKFIIYLFLFKSNNLSIRGKSLEILVFQVNFNFSLGVIMPQFILNSHIKRRLDIISIQINPKGL